MSGLGITDLPLPPDDLRADFAPPCQRTGKSFETLPEALEEDLKRAKLIRRARLEPEVPFDRHRALELAERLQECGTGLAEHGTMASKVYMGRQRIRIGGALWKLADEQCDLRTFTTIRRGLVFNAAELLVWDPTLFMGSFLSALNRRGADTAEGQLFAGLHGEWDPGTGLFHLHCHGLARGELLRVVRSLRTLPNYRRGTAAGDRFPRVKVGRQPLNNLPYPLLYTVQSYWPLRWRGEFGRGPRRRIPEPYHTALLLWLDRWSLRDITLIRGMRVGQQGFILNDKKTYTNGDGR